MLASLMYTIIVVGGYMHIALILSGGFASVIAILNGYTWSFLEKGIIRNISHSMQALLILLTVGMLIGTWIAGGIIQTMIYYGLMILNPNIFLVAACLICCIVSLSTGSSWTTAGTIGIALVIYAILGMGQAGSSADMSEVGIMMDGLKENFNISPILLIPPLFIILMIVFKIPAMPGLLGGALLGVICAVIFQGGNAGELIGITMYEGYYSETGIVFLDDLLTRGGLSAMFYSAVLVLCAMVIGGVLEASDMLAIVCEKLLVFAKNTGSLVFIVLATCISMNILAADQYVAIVLPGRMFKQEFEDRRLKNKNLSRCLEDAGTMTSALVPWSTCGVYMSSTLGVATLAYLPFAFLNLINPLVSLFYGITGITMEKMTEEEYQAILQQRELEKTLALQG